MRGEREIRDMLERFDAAITDDDDIDDDTRAAWDTLCWVVDDGRSDSLVADYIPEEHSDDR